MVFGEVIAILKTVLWPAVVLILVIVFRQPISAFLRNVETVKAAGVELTTGKQNATSELLRRHRKYYDKLADAMKGRAEAGLIAAMAAIWEFQAPTGPPPRILWVDDRPENNKSETDTLESLGLKVSTATSNKQAREMLDRENFHLVLTDIRRDDEPEDGFDLAEWLRKEAPLLPVIMYAGYVDEQRAKKAVDWDVAGITSSPSQLIFLVTKYLMGPRAR